MYKLLSFPLTEDMPVFGDNPPVRIKVRSSHENGDLYDQYIVETANHNGTHIDAPRHFNPDGARIADLPVNNFIFHSPVVIDLPKGDGELITGSDLEGLSANFENADLLLIRTGFGKLREIDPARYKGKNPGFHPSAATYLMENSPHLRAIGMDLVSATSATHISEGIQFHQLILGCGRKDKRAILLIEDVNLNQELDGLGKVTALPLLVEGVDSGPCTIVGEF